MAARATFALKAGVWFRRGRLDMVSPDSQATACLLSGRNSTYRPVQISGAGSVLLSKRALTSYATVASLIVVCWLGYYLGQAYLVGDRIFHKLVLVEGVMEGRIIRGGERGVLIYNPAAKEIVLLKWDAIKQI